MGLTEAQQKFIELDKKKDEVGKFLAEYKAASEAVFNECPANNSAYFQDAEGIVYKPTIPEGKYIHFESWHNTRCFTINSFDKSFKFQVSTSLDTRKILGIYTWYK